VLDFVRQLIELEKSISGKTTLSEADFEDDWGYVSRIRGSHLQDLDAINCTMKSSRD
jgi:hypothetical protein